jgi:hypothetical protein
VSDPVTRDAFARHLDTSFRVHDVADDGLVLVEVSERRADSRQETFSLLFRGSADRALTQATWRLGHPVLGDLHIFLVPVGQDERGRYYEAVFNRLLPPGSTRA